MTLTPFAVPEYTAADFSQETWWLSLIKAVFIIVFLIANVLLALWVERRGLGRMQTRPGPNVAGPLGLFQAFADAGKLLFKEDMWTRRAERFLYFLAPAIAAFAAFSVYAVIPMGPNVKIGNISTPLQLADMPVASPVHPGDCLAGSVRHRPGWLVDSLDPAAVRRRAFLRAGHLLRTGHGPVPRERVPHVGLHVHLADRRSPGAVLVGIHPVPGVRHLLHQRHPVKSTVCPSIFPKPKAKSSPAT